MDTNSKRFTNSFSILGPIAVTVILFFTGPAHYWLPDIGAGVFAFLLLRWSFSLAERSALTRREAAEALLAVLKNENLDVRVDAYGRIIWTTEGKTYYYAPFA